MYSGILDLCATLTPAVIPYLSTFMHGAVPTTLTVQMGTDSRSLQAPAPALGLAHTGAQQFFLMTKWTNGKMHLWTSKDWIPYWHVLSPQFFTFFYPGSIRHVLLKLKWQATFGLCMPVFVSNSVLARKRFLKYSTELSLWNFHFDA